ncbi:hypothetical protein Tco_0348970 [Tanacetum coccineum]
MSSASTVTYTYVYTDSEPGKLVSSPSPNYVPGPEHPPSPDYVTGPEQPPLLIEVPYVPEPEYLEYLTPSDAETPWEDQPLPADASPDEEPFEDEDDDEEKEHLAPADSPTIPIVDPIPSAWDTKAFETDETAPTPVPSPRRHTARISIRPEAPMPFPSEEEVERLLALPIPPPSPLSPWSSPLPQIPSPRLPVSSPPLPLPPSTVDSPTYAEAPLGYRAAGIRLRASSPYTTSITTITNSTIITTFTTTGGESSTAAPRPTRGHRIDYGFIGTLDAKTRRQRAEEVGYGIKDVWLDPTEAVEEVAPTTLEVVNARVTELATVQEQDTHDIYDVIEDTQDSRPQLFQRDLIDLVYMTQFYYETARLLYQRPWFLENMGTFCWLSLVVHYYWQAYRTHYSRCNITESPHMIHSVTTLIAQVSSLQGQLSATLGQIQALQTRDQTHANDREGAGSSA